jgi:hypothetical protein
VRRASFVITTEEDRRDLDELGLAREDLHGDESALLQRLGRGPLSLELESLTASAKQTLAGMHGARPKRRSSTPSRS